MCSCFIETIAVVLPRKAPISANLKLDRSVGRGACSVRNYQLTNSRDMLWFCRTAYDVFKGFRIGMVQGSGKCVPLKRSRLQALSQKQITKYGTWSSFLEDHGLALLIG